MKKFLCAGFLLLIGILIGFLISSNPPKEEVQITREPTESEIIAYMENQESDQLTKWDEIAQLAIEGDIESSLKMYNHNAYAYGNREFERAYFWAVLCERQGWDTEKNGEIVKSAEVDIRAKYWSRTRDPDRREIRDPEGISDLLPSVD